MFHNTYTTPWLISNQIPKSPFFFTYGDIPLFTMDHLAAYMPVAQHPLYTAPSIALEVPNMKRIPVNALMQSVKTLNNYIPILRHRNVTQTLFDRQFSKESLTESSLGDSGLSSSRSSTPSSVELSNASDTKALCNILPNDGSEKRRNLDHSNSQVQQSRRYHQNQRYNVQNPKKFNQANKKPQQNIKDEWQKVTKEIWDHFRKNKQKEEMKTEKMKLKKAVHNLLLKDENFQNCNLTVVGSSVNGLGTNSSDADMCLIVSDREMDQQTEAMDYLLYIQDKLSKCWFVKSTDLITAKVPILKFTDKFNNIQVDLNINNIVGIANTQLLGTYSQLDCRVPPLVLVIKKWAQDSQINNAKEMTLSSYSLVLMVIHYLQCGCDPVVLPCLQQLHNRRYEHGDLWKWMIPYGERINFQSSNIQSLGSLLYGFFDYYTNRFDFAKDVISVRLGCKLPKHVAMNYTSTKNKRGHWKFICIEEPFNRTNTACAVYDQDSFNRITSAFKAMWLHLSNKKELSPVLSS